MLRAFACFLKYSFCSTGGFPPVKALISIFPFSLTFFVTAGFQKTFHAGESYHQKMMTSHFENSSPPHPSRARLHAGGGFSRWRLRLALLAKVAPQ